jgi:hypothetical protein
VEPSSTGHSRPRGARKRIVAGRGMRHNVNGFVVNKSAPELFPVIYLIKKWFTRRKAKERRAFDRTGINDYSSLKTISFLCLRKCPLY